MGYGPGAQRFAGATYDPTSNYRAARVFRFFADQGLTPDLLRRSYQHQLAVLAQAFDALGLPDAVVTRDRGRRWTPSAASSPCAARRPPGSARRWPPAGVKTDTRGDILRVGPAPYLSDAQLTTAIAHLGEAAIATGTAAAG